MPRQATCAPSRRPARPHQGSDKVVLLAGSAMFPGHGMARVCGPEDLDVVATNAPVDTATGASLQDARIEIVVAGRVQT